MPKSTKPATLGELRESGYQVLPVKEEMRQNLMRKMRDGEEIFPGIVGYDETVVPQIENAILSGQDIIFLGERGQAKTRMARSLVNLLDEEMPDHRRLRDQRRPVRADLRRRAATLVAEQGDDTPIDWIAARPPLRREAGHARHHDRRPDRRGRPDQGRRGPLPLRRADDPLRPDAAHQPRHLLHQRAARPGRAHPGRPAQHHGRARRADPRLQGPPAARRLRGRQRQPGGLHQPRPHHHAAQGPLRLADPHALPAHDRARDRHHGAGALRRSRPTASRSIVPAVHEGDRRRDHAPGAPQPRHQPALRRQRARLDLPTTRTCSRNALRRAIRLRRAAGRARASATCSALIASTAGKIELETVGDVNEEQGHREADAEARSTASSTATSRSASSTSWSRASTTA